ncbi:MAG TPA: alpha/beta hydrolase [Polyangiales bacterium]|nr:alpha/beta hydrolase [Polyangiales bacterium]
MGKGLENTLAVLNGLVGNYLARTGNELATQMALYHDERPLRTEPAALAAAFPRASSRLVVFVHGLMNTERIWRLPDGSDYGSLLERDLGWTAAYVRYNSGVAIAENGARFAALLEQLVAAYPVQLSELALVGFSMGGLVIRSACHAAGTSDHAWLKHVRRIVYVGTPHLGAPGERFGKLTSQVLRAIPNAYTRLISDIADLRSDGIQDLAHAALRAEDRALVRSPWDLRDARHPVPLLPNIQHHLIAGSLFTDPRLALLFGDSVVHVASATYGGLALELLPPERVHVLPGLAHIALAHHPAVYQTIKTTLEQAP